MNDPIIFTEKQRFTQWWLILLLVIVNILIVSTLILLITGSSNTDFSPKSLPFIIMFLLLAILITSAIFFVQLETLIKADGIYVRFFPFQKSYRFIRWTELSKSYVRRYNPLAEYGGWGYRLNLFGKGKAYNVAGNYGLQLEFTNGKKLLIGTQKPEVLESALQQVKPIQLNAY